ncbi:hypothetical protein Enr10x_56740 [Gimesia panareensis]|uniref:Uncharacterized protein n=1 Tax=Gimesia panareensis TaxID=2527978 RepID=A0A517QF87_9PLAN|nr:hypothetical protein Enr10x_56740 [Gimesia panareensis]
MRMSCKGLSPCDGWGYCLGDLPGLRFPFVPNFENFKTGYSRVQETFPYLTLNGLLTFRVAFILRKKMGYHLSSPVEKSAVTID